MSINKLPLKKLVEFRRLSEKRKPTFAENFKNPKQTKGKDGGHYWSSCIGGVGTAFKLNDNSIINERIDRIKDKQVLPAVNTTKVNQQRNMDILKQYIGFNFSIWRPDEELVYLPISKSENVLKMNGLSIEVRPNYIFTFGEDNTSIGGIWFDAWQEGFKKSDLGIYSEVIFRYLSSQYSDSYKVEPFACIAVDISNVQAIRYSNIIDGIIPSMVETSIDDFNKYLK